MANIVPRPLNRFRKTDNHRMFHERWGDVAISAPTDTTYPNPPQRSLSRRRTSRHSTTIDAQSSRSSSLSDISVDHNDDDDDTICLVDRSSSSSSTTPSRQNSFSLNPRRLSMRLAPRPRLPSDDTKEMKDKKSEFAYKPIHQDYPTEVAEKASSRQHPPSPSRFRYIPAAPQYSGDLETASWKRYSTMSRASMQAEGTVVRLPSRPCNRHSTLSEEAYEDEDDDGESTRSVASYPQRSACRRSVGYGQRAVSVSAKNASSSSDKKRARASRCLTMTMVPDPEDIYG